MNNKKANKTFNGYYKTETGSFGSAASKWNGNYRWVTAVAIFVFRLHLIQHDSQVNTSVSVSSAARIAEQLTAERVWVNTTLKADVKGMRDEVKKISAASE